MDLCGVPVLFVAVGRGRGGGRGGGTLDTLATKKSRHGSGSYCVEFCHVFLWLGWAGGLDGMGVRACELEGSLGFKAFGVRAEAFRLSHDS